MNKKLLLPVFLLVLISTVVYHRWLSFNIFTNGDWVFYFSNIYKNLSLNYTWIPLSDLGVINLTLWRFILVFTQSLFANFGYAFNVSEKITIFWPTIFFANVFSFPLFKKILKSNLAAFIGSIVFNYNTYYLIIGGGFLIYAASPWVLMSLLIFINALETEKKYLYALSGLTLFVAGSYDFRVAYIGIFLLFFYSLYYFFFIKNLKFSMDFFKGLFRSFITFFTFIFLNIYWVLPMLKLGSLTSNPVLDRGLFGNEFLNILYSITLFHPFWTGAKPAWFTVEPIMFYFWLIPTLAFLGFWLNRKNKIVLFFGIIALLGIFLTKQVAYPFGGIYSILFKYLPGFNAFREASKFYFLIALGYAVLIGAFVKYIFENFKKTKIYFKYTLVILIAFLFLWNVKPILTGEISGIFVPRHMPNDHLIVNNFILKGSDYYKTLWVPSSSTWSVYTVDHPLLNLVDANNYYKYWIKYVNNLPIAKFSLGETMIKALNLSSSNNLLDLSSVKYVFVPIRDVANDADFFVYYGESRQYYINELSKIKYLHKINIGTKEIVVYENFNYKPHIYITNNQESISNNQEYKTVNFKFVNPTEYKISLKNIKGPMYLNFSESFHPQWRIRAGEFNWLDVITKKDYFIDNKYHLQNDANLNSFYLDLKQVCKQSASCVKNKDGSYDINLTLYFAPQSYLYLGLIISGCTLVLIVGYLFFVLGRKLYAKIK